MNAAQRFAIRLTARIAPPLKNLLESSGARLDLAADEILMLRAERDMQRGAGASMRAEMIEAFALDGGTSWRGNEGKTAEQTPVLKEALAELELALEDRGWKRQLALADTEFSRWGIQMIIRISRLYFIKNPLIRRGVSISAYYVFGRGIDISSADKPTAALIKAFVARNQKLLGQCGLVQQEQCIQTDGNIFFAFFTDVDTGEVELRTIDPLEIEEIVTDPEDAAKPWYYKRAWVQQQFSTSSGITKPVQKVAWYCAVGYEPELGVKDIKGQPIATDKGGFVQILHVKEGALPNWRFGCPPVYPAIDWARAYKNFLENWASITAALARFSWDVETKGGLPAIAALKSTFATTLANDGTQTEQNPPPVTGAAFISGPGNKLTPIKTAGATTEPEQGRRVLLMCCAAFGLPETFFGDASTGSLATAISLDRPTELKFLLAQEKWREVIKAIFAVACERSEKAPSGKLREARKARQDQKEAPEIDVIFPAVLEHDISKQVAAIVESMTLNGFEPTGIDEKTGMGLLLQEVGVEDVEDVLEIMYPKATYDKLADRTPLMQAQREQALNPPETQPEGPSGAPPKAPAPRKPHAKRIAAQESGQIRKAVEALTAAAAKLSARGTNGTGQQQ